MDWILYAVGGTVIAIAVVVIAVYVAFILYMEMPVRYEERPSAAEVAFEEGKIYLLYHNEMYYIQDERLASANVGDQVGVIVHSTYNRREDRITRRLTLNDPDL